MAYNIGVANFVRIWCSNWHGVISPWLWHVIIIRDHDWRCERYPFKRATNILDTWKVLYAKQPTPDQSHIGLEHWTPIYRWCPIKSIDTQGREICKCKSATQKSSMQNERRFHHHLFRLPYTHLGTCWKEWTWAAVDTMISNMAWPTLGT